MTVPVPQFGELPEHYVARPGAYGVIFDDAGNILIVVTRNGRWHLPGGGIDAGEDPEEAVKREVKEEAGYEISSLKYIGAANQFLDTKDLGPINKEAVYFTGKLSGGSLTDSREDDHVVSWVSAPEFLSSNAHDFHKWAVEQIAPDWKL